MNITNTTNLNNQETSLDNITSINENIDNATSDSKMKISDIIEHALKIDKRFEPIRKNKEKRGKLSEDPKVKKFFTKNKEQD